MADKVLNLVREKTKEGITIDELQKELHCKCTLAFLRLVHIFR